MGGAGAGAAGDGELPNPDDAAAGRNETGGVAPPQWAFTCLGAAQYGGSRSNGAKKSVVAELTSWL